MTPSPNLHTPQPFGLSRRGHLVATPGIRIVACFLLSLALSLASMAQTAVFSPLVYSVATDSVQAGEQGGSGSLDWVNPILPGCYPDPSICRVGDDYYLVNSSFAYAPGIPIWHSTNLRDWERLGYVLNRPSQLPLREDVPIRQGIFACDIKYNPFNNLYYLISTDVDGLGTFFVTTDDPKQGQWSEPTYLPEVGGIDPSFLFDTDGRAYILNNDAPDGEPLYPGHRCIWMREFDWLTGQTVTQQRVIVSGGVDVSQKPGWVEGPHLYHIGDTYFLMCAEGGTSSKHHEVLFSSSSVDGPYVPCAVSTILSQRELSGDRPGAVSCTGHADLVQTPEGDWYAVFLGMRRYKGSHDAMGRETFLLPVSWTDGQPVILPLGEAVTSGTRPVPPTPLWTAQGLSVEAFGIRSLQVSAEMIDADGLLHLPALPATIAQPSYPSTLGRWVTDYAFEAQTAVRFTPADADDFAGLILFQDERCHVRFGTTLQADGTPCLRLVALSKGEVVADVSAPLPAAADQPVHLRVEGVALPAKRGRDFGYRFSYTLDPAAGWTAVGDPITADYFSTRTAGNFTGTMLGVYATASATAATATATASPSAADTLQPGAASVTASR